jgi:hypothetical protein
MRRLITLPIVAFALACQAVTGNFSVGASAQDSGTGGNDGGGMRDSTAGGADAADATADQGGPVDGALDATTDASAAPDGPAGADGASVDGFGADDGQIGDVGADSAEAGPACLSTLSGVGTADFHIAFTLTTTNTSLTLALVNQRVNCQCLSVSACSSPSTFWDVVIDPAGGIIAMTDDDTAASYVFVEAGNSVNDGQPHQIVVARTSGMLWYSKDGVIGSAEVADAYSFGTFPALTIGSDVCSTTTPLAGNGTLTDLCITTP